MPGFAASKNPSPGLANVDDGPVPPSVSIEGVDGSKVHELQTLFTAYLLYPDIRAIVDAGEFSRLSTDARLNLKELKNLGEPQRKLALNYIKDTIVINRYLAE